jgi:hypothetical protein
MLDTSPAMQQVYYKHLAQLSPAQRLERLVRLNEALLALIHAGIKQQHPSATERELDAHVADRRYGRDVAARFFPDVFPPTP